ncbi:uncharacterized protein C6orf163 homolog [Halyomorpha halys]|uniref:uncharacterized protein C6orf163 homolog n=1 Tax=Halyomorpha halys TaxID=286706 RepID=UPI0006D4F3D9|nr:uncharacterized protein LOC106689280 [Halyomorpha halys]
MTATHYHLLPTEAWADDGCTYLKKAKFLKNHQLPDIDEVRLSVGYQLADIFFSQASDGIKRCVGYDKKLEGPKEQLWISPSDQLMGKVVLTEPYPRQEVQAMTHQNILEIGENLEKKFERTRKAAIEAALKKKEEEVRKEMEELLAQKVDETRKEMEDIYRNRLQYAKQQLHLQYKAVIADRDLALCRKADEKIQASLSYLRQSMAEEMELMLKRRIEYNQELNSFQRTWDANKANEQFKKKVNNLKKKWIKILKKAKRKCELEKKELEARLIDQHAIQLEKTKETCNDEFQVSLQARTRNYRKTICDLLKTIKRKDQEYKKLEEEKECVHVEQYSWCYLVRELLKQYQKLINYALRVKSGHAEYFLSLHKILQSRIESLANVDFLQKYIQEKGPTLTEKNIVSSNTELKLQALKVIREEQIESPDYPCLPIDVLEKRERKKKIEKRNEAIQNIKKTLDDLIRTVVPKLTELPCIPSELWSSGKSEENNVSWPADPKPPGLRIVGDGLVSREQPWTRFAEDRVKSLIRVLNRYPMLKLNIIGNS